MGRDPARGGWCLKQRSSRSLTGLFSNRVVAGARLPRRMLSPRPLARPVLLRESEVSRC